MSDIVHATMLIQNSQTSVHKVLWLQYWNDHKWGGGDECEKRGEEEKKLMESVVRCIGLRNALQYL